MKPAAQAEAMEERQLLSSSGLFIPATGELNLQLGSQDNVRVSSVSGNVLVETSTGTGSYSPLLSLGTVSSASVQSLVIFGGDDANTIDLNGVTAAAFSALASIEVDAANGHDAITGSPDFADSIIGGHGHDTINGQGGNDTINGGDGNDSITAGDGDDTIRGGDGQDSITGDAGNDTVDSGDGDDTVSGGDGNDSISADNGEDSLNGDAGDDTINGDGGTDTVSGDDGNDSILGGEFADSLLGGAGDDTINGQAGNDNIDGGDGDDSLKGGANNDLITGNAGNDTLNGESEADQLSGGDGNDSVLGGGGDDSLNGNAGNDTLAGQAGDDTLIGGGDADSLNGGAGNDFVASVVQSVSIASTLTVPAEGDSGTSNASIAVNLSVASTSTVTVDFTTQNGTATAGSDFQTVSGTLTFAPGVTSQTIEVPIVGDTTFESNETFTVVLSNPVNVGLGQAQCTVTITDDDAASVGQFDIQISFSSGLTASQQAAFTAAELRWESILTSDLADVAIPGIGLIDDLRIDASGVSIDGAGGILGQAGPDFLRPGSFLPAHGIMQFDTADLAALEASGQLQDTILHEMAHVLGFGTIWSNLGLLTNPAAQGGTDPRFIGLAATQEYNARFGTNDSGVPVEASGGAGTADGHWRESVFNNELMTGFLDTPGPNPLSRVTIAQFADLGYQVNFTPADNFLRTTPTTVISSGGVRLPSRLRVNRPAKEVLPTSALMSQSVELKTERHAVGPNVGFDTPTVNVAGQGFTGALPPDTDGEVGPDHYVQVVNGTIGALVRIYDKSGNVLTSFPMSSLATSGPATNGAGDGMVVYDQLADRWVLMEFTGSANGFAVYVSQTPDPTNGLWNNYFFATSQFPDYPKISVWPDAYYITTNESNPAVYALDRTNMLTGAAARPMQRFAGPSLAGLGFQAFSPADLDGATAPAVGAPAMFLRQNDDELNNPGANNPAADSLQMFQLQVDFNTPANSTFTQVATLSVGEFDSDFARSPLFQGFGSIPQPNGTLLDPIPELLMSRTHYRNFGAYEALVGTFVTDTNNTDHAGVRWFELRRVGGGNWTLFQEGLVNPDNIVSRWMPSIDMDGAGNIALGYSVSGTTTFPSLRYTGRLATDPLGTMPQGEFTIINGTGSQQGSDRWGDYASMTVDPADDSTFWFTSEYALASGIWATQITAFSFDTGGGGGGGGGGDGTMADVGDTLIGGDGDDTVIGGEGNDTISGQGGNDSLLGGAGDDSMLGGAGQDTLDGQAGNDTLDGQGGSDTVFGGEGDDTFVFNPTSSGVETIDGGDGLNTALANGTNGADAITIGSTGNLLTVSSAGSTLIVNGQLQDLIVNGLAGDDTLTVGDVSGVGFVQIVVRGGDGNDTLTAAGTNIGSARLSLNGDNGNDVLTGSLGNDTINGGAGNDAANGGAGHDTIRGGTGNDQLGGGLGNDLVDGGDGNDFATGDEGNDSVFGGNGNDTLKGADGADTLNGEAGNDNLNGMAGDDSVLGGVGKDALAGGAGNDTLDGGRNDDTISGNSGNDKIRGDHGHDYIDSGDGNNTVNGGDGNDTILASDGADLLNGGDGNDQINAGNGNDTITGSDGNDSIQGGGGQDVILGGDGDDYIDGQGGTDIIAGGQGIDVIVDPADEIDEQFVLSAAVLLALQAN